MKAIVLLLAVLSCVSCAEYSGATYGAATAVYAGNGDAGGGDARSARIISEFRARTFMTDLQAGSFGPRKAVVAGQNQSKVALSAIRTAGTLGASVVTANLAEAVSNNGSAEVINASNNALAATQAKEVTKQAATASKAALDLEKLPFRSKLPIATVPP